MRGTSRIRMMLGLSLLALVLLATLPAAEAQGPVAPRHILEVQVEHDPDPVLPMTESRRVTFHVSVECSAPALDAGLEPKRLSYQIHPAQSWATATLSKHSQDIDRDVRDCVQGAKWIFPVEGEIAFTKDAPAFYLTEFIFEAWMDTGEHTRTTFTLRPAFYERWQAQFERTILKGAPNEQVQVPLTVENHGNGAIQLHFVLAESSSKDLNVALPAPLIVPSVIAGGDTSRNTATVMIQLPLESERQDMLVLIIRGNSADDVSIPLTQVERSAILVTSGDVPPEVGELGIPNLLPLLGVAIAALAARRRL